MAWLVEHDHQLVSPSDEHAPAPTLREVEQRYVHAVLAACSGSKTWAAEILGVDRRTVYRMLARKRA